MTNYDSYLRGVCPGGTITAEDVKLLTAPFAKDKVSVKVQSFNKERTKAMLVLYLQHTDVMDRLDAVDPSWNCTVLEERPVGDTVYVRTRMTLKGVSRENVGEGNDPKGAYSDALKRCAMLFGVGRYLYDTNTPWVAYSESQDKYKSWTVEHFEAAQRAKIPSPVTTSPSISSAGDPLTSMLRAFGMLGVSEAMIRDVFPEGIMEPQLDELREVYAKLQKGAAVSDFFKSDAQLQVAASIKNAQANKKPLVSPKVLSQGSNPIGDLDFEHSPGRL